LPRLARGEGWVWAPSDGVLEKVAFPRIRTLDSSATPRREERASVANSLAAVDLAAIRAALAGAHVNARNEPAYPTLAGQGHRLRWEQGVKRQEREISMAHARIAELEAAAAKKISGS